MSHYKHNRMCVGVGWYMTIDTLEYFYH